MCEDPYDGTIQCGTCAAVVPVTVHKGRVVDAKLRKLDLEVPDGIPKDLRILLCQAVACFEAGSPAATVMLAGLFLEGFPATKGMTGDRLDEMIEAVHKAGVISTLRFHVATASRLVRNIGAHYSDELVRLTDSDARLVLEMNRKLANDIISNKSEGGAVQ